MQSKKKKRVLLMEASSRQVLPMARAFYAKGYDITTVCEHKSDLGNVTRFKHRCYVVKNIDSDYKTAERVYDEIVTQNEFDIIVPLSDFSAEIAANHKNDWTKKGCYVAVNDLDIFMLAFDKLNTMRICMENNIPCPFTILAEKEDDIDFDSIKYPVVVKPRSACGSIGFHIAEDEKQLRVLIKDNSHGLLLIQEYIPQTGRQYNAHFVLDEQSNVKTAICTQKCRWFPIDGGASTLCRTVDNDYILFICEKLLKTIGWIGYCDLDLMEDPRDGSIRIIEINARISANVKICFLGGANIVQQIIELSENEELTAYVDYRKDVRLRCMHTDFLWFLKSKKRMKADPSWFSSVRTKDQIFSLDDVLPFFSFSITSVLKYKSEMKKRKR